MTIKQCLCAALAFCAGLILVALVKRPCPPSPRPLAPALPTATALEADLEINLDTDADASGDRYGEYYR